MINFALASPFLGEVPAFRQAEGFCEHIEYLLTKPANEYFLKKVSKT